MSVDTDTSGNHVGPDLTQYDWEYSPIGGSHGGYDFRLYNYDLEMEVEVYPENNDPDEGYNIVVRDLEIINEGTEEEYFESGYPVYTNQAGPWFMELMSAVATAISWCEQHR